MMRTAASILFLAALLIAAESHAIDAVLKWQDNSTNEDGFTVERKLNAGSYAPFAAALGANVVTFTDSTLVSDPMVDNIYCYRVKAFNTAGSSAFSNEECKTVARAPVDGAPTNLTVQ